MSSPGEEYLNWDRKSRISLPSKAADEYMIISVLEFRRLRQRIDETLSPTHDILPAAYFALFGAALATGVAIPPLLVGTGLPSWVIPTFIVSASSFFVLGIALVLVSRAVGNGQRKAASEIVHDMNDLETIYHSSEVAGPLTQPPSSHIPGGTAAWSLPGSLVSRTNDRPKSVDIARGESERS